MKAYVVAAETIKDEAAFDEYRKLVPETVVPFGGGRFIVRGGELTNLEGQWPHPRLVIIEFPSRAGGRLVPVGRVPEDHLAEAREHRGQPDHHRWAL